MKFLTVDEAYHALCTKLLDAPRCGNTHELNNVKIEIKNIRQNVVSIRDISPLYLFGELLWYFNGSNSCEYISKFSSFWEKLTDDGVTSNSSYGFILQKKYGFNQVEKIIELLKKDPLSRRAVLNLNVPNENVIETRDEPCTIALQFLIRDNRLHCTTMMRSNDIWFGTPYDWAFFMELQKVIADRLNLWYGTYTHFATSLHLYDKNYDQVKSIVDKPIAKPIIFDRAKFHDKAKEIFEMTKDMSKDQIQKDFLNILSDFEIYKGGTE